MKFDFKKLLLYIPLTSLALTSCQGMSKTIKVALNLDLMTLSETDKAFPNELTGDDLIAMIETKQDFLLFFHQKNCTLCNVVIPYYNQLLKPKTDNKQPYVPYDMYAFSANSSDFMYISQRYPNLLEQTPKTMLFKKGQNILTFATSRYKSYKTFASAINDSLIPSNIYTATKVDSINQFYLKFSNQPYLVFIRNNDKDSFNEYYSYKYWSDNVYPIVKDSQIPTLLLTYNKLTDDAKKTVNLTYGLDNTSSAIYVNKEVVSKYNYSIVDESSEFINLLNEKF